MEIAFLFSFVIMPLLIGTGEVGLLVYDSIEVSNAAHTGAEYAMRSSTFAANTSGITTAAQADASDFGTSMTVTPTTYYVCATAINGTQYTGVNAQTNANAACTGTYNHAIEFVQVNTSVTVTPVIHLPALASSFTLVGSASMEVE